MPDVSAQRLLPDKAPFPKEREDDGFALEAVLAITLHAAVLMPLVWTTERDPPPTVVQNVEVSTLAEVAPQAGDATNFAEAIGTAPPDTAQVAEPSMESVESSLSPDQIRPPAPEPVQTAALPESAAPLQPPLPQQVLPPPHPTLLLPPEPLIAEMPPPEPIPTETPETAEMVSPPQESVAAPPLAPATVPSPPHSARAVATPPRSTPRPAPPPRPAPAGAPSAEPSPTAPVPPAPRPQLPPNYIGRLLAALDRHKEYPAGARWRHAEGTALLRFTMRRDGTVASWRIERSAGHADLDAAVVQMIQRASPLPAPPAELLGDPVELVVPVKFSFR